MLNTYLKQVQRLIGYDETQALYSLDDLTDFVNQGRQQVAAQGQCIRVSTPVNGSIMEIQVTNPGTGYTAPTVDISPSDAPSGSGTYPRGAQATATAQQIGGKISNVSVGNGGGGYFAPAVSISDPTGTGATLLPVLSPLNQTYFGQEVYKYSDIDLAPFPGVGAVISVRSISIIWAQWQYSLSWVSFTKYQALIRQYVSTFYAPPVWACQFGQGVDGSVHVYPTPDQSYAWTWDCCCLPSDLEDDQSPEAIPDPWRAAVPYWAAHIALLSRAAQIPQLLPLAMRYWNEKDGGMFQAMMRRARAFSAPGRISSMYGRV